MLPDELGDRPGEAFEAVDPGGPAGSQHHGRHALPIQPDARANRDGGVSPTGHHGHGPVGLVPDEGACLAPEEPDRLLDHPREDVRRG